MCRGSATPRLDATGGLECQHRHTSRPYRLALDDGRSEEIFITGLRQNGTAGHESMGAESTWTSSWPDRTPRPSSSPNTPLTGPQRTRSLSSNFLRKCSTATSPSSPASSFSDSYNRFPRPRLGCLTTPRGCDDRQTRISLARIGSSVVSMATCWAIRLAYY